MGGKVWSEEEERIFWELVIPRSTVAAHPPSDPAAQPLSWPDCAQWMNEMAGDNPRRIYTSTMLYEHHYQNIKPGAKSPRAVRFAQKYLSDCEYYKKHNSPRPPSPPRTLTPQDPQLAALLEEQSKPKSRRPRQAARTRQRNVVPHPGLPPSHGSEDDLTLSHTSMGESSGHSTPTEPRSYTSMPANGPGQYALGENRIPAHTGFDIQYQPDRRPMLKPECTTRPAAFLNRSGKPVEGGHWRLAPRNQQNGRPRESMTMTPLSTNIQPRQSHTPQQTPWTRPAPPPIQQSSVESLEEWNGKLPSIRQMLPFVDFGQPTYPPFAYDTTNRAGKRGHYDDQNCDPTPKRRRLPDQPVLRQCDQQTPQQRDGSSNK
ncbi:Ff.00g059140.m01.CDS01 [Fusarium sp. VM40]|nr:Ff.00g059140.m01.CDS01 [Fusarium sp. VM40]